MGVKVSRVTAKGQTTIPAEVRAKLGLKPGDVIIYRETEAGIVIGRARVLDATFLKLRRLINKTLLRRNTRPGGVQELT